MVLRQLLMFEGNNSKANTVTYGTFSAEVLKLDK